MAAVWFIAAATLFHPLARADELEELRRVREQVVELEAALDQLRRLIPPQRDFAADEKWLRQFAESAELSSIEIAPVPGAEHLPGMHGEASLIELDRIDISGRDPLGNVHQFLSRLAFRPRLTRVETLQFDAAPGGNVRYSARLGLPFVAFEPYEPVRGDPLVAARTRLETLRSTVGGLGTFVERRDPLAPLAAVEAEIAEQPVAFTRIRVNGDFVFEGALIGSAAREALLRGLERAQLLPVEQQFSRTGPCQMFSIRARLEPGETTYESLIGDGSFDHDPGAMCDAARRGEAKRHLIRGSAPPSETRLAMHLQNLDLSDVFNALHSYLGEDFVVDGDLDGRVTLEILEGITLDDLWAELPAIGVTIGQGPLRHVTRTGPTPTPDASRSGGATDPVSFLIKHATVSDVLCLIGRISDREIEVPLDFRARVSVFADDVPLDELLAGVIASARLESSTAGGRLTLRRPEKKGEAGVLACENLDFTSSSPLSRLQRRMDLLEIADVQVVGVGRVGESWTAWAYIPGRYLTPLEEGNALLDGTVRSIGPEGVVFTTRSGEEIRASVP